MNAPSFLPVILSILMLAVAVYSVWRLGIARAWGRESDIEADVLHFAAGIAAAGLLCTWARTLPRGAWAGLFAAGVLYFAIRAAVAWRARGSGVGVRAPLARFGVCAVLVYCFLAGVAPSTIHGSSAGQYTMAGMPGMIVDQTVDLPALGLILVAGLAFYAVSVVARLSPEPQQAGAGTVPAPRSATAAQATTTRGVGGLLAPRSLEVCQVALVVVLAYAILSKIV